MKKKLGITALLISGLVANHQANAAIGSNNGISNGERSASVTIVEPLALAVTRDLAFGKVQRPLSGSNTVIVSSGGVVSGTATRLGGTIDAGSYSISGDTVQTIAISITSDGSVEGMTLTNFDQKYSGSTFTNGSTLSTPPGSGKPLLVGATLNIPSGVTPGIKTLTYNINVQYQ